LVITGKGGPKKDYNSYRFRDFENDYGVLKREVPMWLSSGSMRHMVVSFQDALQSDGGGGALYVVLKRLL
jgi:DNA-nicking Smr family endonuclease